MGRGPGLGATQSAAAHCKPLTVTRGHSCMRRVKYLSAFVAFVTQLSLAPISGQTNLPSPAVQLAVSNILSRFTNEQAKAAYKAKLAAEFPEPVILPLNVRTGWSTNGPAVFSMTRLAITNYNKNPILAELNRLG